MGQSSQTQPLKVMQNIKILRIGLSGKVMQNIKILRIRLSVWNFKLNVSVKQNERWKNCHHSKFTFSSFGQSSELQAFGDLD
jgi:hypothetical protein